MESKSSKSISKTTLTTLRGETPRERMLHRLHGVALVLYGYSASEAGRIYGDSPRAVAYWVNRFQKDGFAGLAEEARPGRPSKLNPKQIKKLQTFLGKISPSSESDQAEMIAVFLKKELGIELTVRQCWRILKRLKS